MQATAAPAGATAAPTQPRPPHRGAPGPTPLRVTGALTCDARLTPTMGQPPHQMLWLDFAPHHGLPYKARVDLGTDLADHMQAEALLPQLRAGAVVTVAANALELRTDHGHAALALVDARDVLVLA